MLGWFLWKKLLPFLEKQVNSKESILSDRLMKADQNFEAERTASEKRTSAFLEELRAVSQANREAHEREMKQVLDRLETSDNIAARQTDILDGIKDLRTKRK